MLLSKMALANEDILCIILKFLNEPSQLNLFLKTCKVWYGLKDVVYRWNRELFPTIPMHEARHPEMAPYREPKSDYNFIINQYVFRGMMRVGMLEDEERWCLIWRSPRLQYARTIYEESYEHSYFYTPEASTGLLVRFIRYDPNRKLYHFMHIDLETGSTLSLRPMLWNDFSVEWWGAGLRYKNCMVLGTECETLWNENNFVESDDSSSPQYSIWRPWASDSDDSEDSDSW